MAALLRGPGRSRQRVGAGLLQRGDEAGAALAAHHQRRRRRTIPGSGGKGVAQDHPGGQGADERVARAGLVHHGRRRDGVDPGTVLAFAFELDAVGAAGHGHVHARRGYAASPQPQPPWRSPGAQTFRRETTA